MPAIDGPQKKVFELEPAETPDPKKTHRYEWNFIISYGSLDVLTRLERNPHAKDQGIEIISIKGHDIPCRPCLEFKIRRAEHKRTTHTYVWGQESCTEILRAVNENVPGMPPHVEQDFIWFMDVHSGFSFVTSLETTVKTPQLTDGFLTKMENQLGHKTYWFFSDNAGEYTSRVMREMLADMNINHVAIIVHKREENHWRKVQQNDNERRKDCTEIGENELAVLDVGISTCYGQT